MLLAIVLPSLRFAYHGPALHIVLETAEALIAALAAYLLFGRFRTTRSSSDLVLVGVLTTLALTNLILVAIPSALTPLTRAEFTVWAPLLARSVAAGGLAVAAFASGRTDLSARAAGGRVLGGTVGLVLLIGTVVAAVGDGLPSLVSASLSPELSTRPVLRSHPVVLGAQLVMLLCFTAAAVSFTRRAEREDSQLLAWLGAGCALGATARATYALFPSLYTEWVYIGDVMRLGFYLALLVGCSREIRSYWQQAAEAAVADERRRIARDLHDGLAQELAYIATRSTALARTTGDGHGAQVAAAAQRALDESRRAIAVLTAVRDESLEDVVAESAEQVAGRFGLDVRLDLEPGLVVGPRVREELGRIVREAVTNAGKHSGAAGVHVRLWRDEAVHLRIHDDGAGFRPGSGASSLAGGFGLVSMRERAQTIGGTLRVTSEPGTGTSIEVVLPDPRAPSGTG